MRKGRNWIKNKKKSNQSGGTTKNENDELNREQEKTMETIEKETANQSGSSYLECENKKKDQIENPETIAVTEKEENTTVNTRCYYFVTEASQGKPLEGGIQPVDFNTAALPDDVKDKLQNTNIKLDETKMPEIQENKSKTSLEVLDDLKSSDEGETECRKLAKQAKEDMVNLTTSSSPENEKEQEEMKLETEANEDSEEAKPKESGDKINPRRHSDSGVCVAAVPTETCALNSCNTMPTVFTDTKQNNELDINTERYEQIDHVLSKISDLEGTGETKPKLQDMVDEESGDETQDAIVQPQTYENTVRSLQNSSRDQTVECLKDLLKPLIVEAIQSILPSIPQNPKGLDKEPVPPVADELNNINIYIHNGKGPNDQLKNEIEPNDQLQNKEGTDDQLQNEDKLNSYIQNDTETNDQLKNEKEPNDQLQNAINPNDQLELEEINLEILSVTQEDLVEPKYADNKTKSDEFQDKHKNEIEPKDAGNEAKTIESKDIHKKEIEPKDADNETKSDEFKDKHKKEIQPKDADNQAKNIEFKDTHKEAHTKEVTEEVYTNLGLADGQVLSKEIKPEEPSVAQDEEVIKVQTESQEAQIVKEVEAFKDELLDHNKEDAKDPSDEGKVLHNLELPHQKESSNQTELQEVKLEIFAVVSPEEDSKSSNKIIPSNKVDKERDIEIESNKQQNQAMAIVIDCEGTSDINPELQLNFNYGKISELFGLVLPQKVGEDKSVKKYSKDPIVEYLRALFKPLIVEAVQNIVPSSTKNARELEKESSQLVADEFHNIKEPNEQPLNENGPSLKVQNDKDPNYQLQNEKKRNDKLHNNEEPNYELKNEMELNDELQEVNELNDQLQNEKELNDQLQSEKERNDQHQNEKELNDQLQNKKEPNYQLKTEQEPNHQLLKDKEQHSQLEPEEIKPERSSIVQDVEVTTVQTESQEAKIVTEVEEFTDKLLDYKKGGTKESSDEGKVQQNLELHHQQESSNQTEEVKLEKLVQEPEESEALYAEALQIITQSVVPELINILHEKFSYRGRKSGALTSDNEMSTVEDSKTPINGLDVYSLLNPSSQIKTISVTQEDQNNLIEPEDADNKAENDEFKDVPKKDQTIEVLDDCKADINLVLQNGTSQEIEPKKTNQELEEDEVDAETLHIFTQSVVPELKKILQEKFSHLGRHSAALTSDNEISTVEDSQTPTNGLDVYSLLNPSIQIKTIDTPNFESTRIEEPDEEERHEERLSMDLTGIAREMVVEQQIGDQQHSEDELKDEVMSNDQVAEDNESDAKTNGSLDLDTTFDTTDGGEIKPSQEVLRFHSVHGDNIWLSKNNFRAQRKKKSNFFSKGIAFSSRPVAIGEKVSLGLKQLSSYWLGLITIGFTTNDPKSIANNLPASVINERNCADGFWAEHLDKKYYQESCRIHYYLNSSGNMCFGVNDVDKIEFLWNLETTKPVWALIDVFGYFTTVEFDIPKDLRNTSFVEKSSLLSERNESSDSWNRSVEDNQTNRTGLNYQTRFVPLDLYTQFKGSCIKFLEDRGICITTDDKEGCLHGKFPLFPGQTIVVQNLSVGKALFHVGVKYGSSTTDASSTSLKPFQTNLHVKDELSITFTESGEIRVTKNLEVPKTIIKVNRSQELWPFVKIFKRNQMIKLWSSNTPSLAVFLT